MVATIGHHGYNFHMNRRREEERRPEHRLLRVATRHIARKGVQSLEVRNLAKAAGTSTARFYQYFECRDKILEDIFEAGWSIIERRISERVIVSATLEDTLMGIVEGALDAFDDDPDAVSATLVLGQVTIGQEVRKRLRSTHAFGRFRRITDGLAARMSAETGMPADEAMWTFELWFGAIARVFYLRTPLGKRRSEEDKKAILATVRRMLMGGLIMSAGVGGAGHPSND